MVGLVEIAETAEEFVKKALAPARVEQVKLVHHKNGNTIATVTVKQADRGIAIGREGRNIARARILAKRHFDVTNVTIA